MLMLFESSEVLEHCVYIYIFCRHLLRDLGTFKYVCRIAECKAEPNQQAPQHFSSYMWTVHAVTDLDKSKSYATVLKKFVK